ncbi:alpha/beta hydrolase [Stieleria sp. TO1_6]|uniref:alpha/beta hydrolase n=1 Tax=Stieleria tagensis TaxID=2956795 RepID=UPI00209AC8B2|nr:alpha/beta hydrolase [Stieleria tagensis]MCO8124197.1 alpha/beta hydrolase [Stieleria tagensis]
MNDQPHRHDSKRRVAIRYRGLGGPVVLAVIAFCCSAAVLRADERVVLKSGIALQGLMTEIASLNENPFQAGGRGEIKTRPILLVDDGLRRVYVHHRGMVAGARQDVRGVERTIELKQAVPLGGKAVQGIGDILGATDFNSYGRRTLSVRGPEGTAIEIDQGITELNARYAKLEALKAKPAYQWDMRVATSSIMPQTLQAIFRQRIDQADYDQRLMVVRFFIESGRLRVAEEELSRTIRDFPDQKDMEAQLIGIVQGQARQLIDEAVRRAEVGQVDYARQVFSRFPMDAVGSTTRERVKIALEKLDETDQQVASLLDSLAKDIAQLPAEQLLPAQRDSLQDILQEITSGLSAATLRRLSDYSRLRDSATVPLENRVALAVAGWLMGAGSGEQNLIVATALIQVRDLVAEYLGTADANRRLAILETLKTIEGAQIEYVDRLLPMLAPVKSWPDDSQHPDIPGCYQINQDADYVIQLPPEYDPLREYPCLVVLSPPSAPPGLELAWWAGDFDAAQNARSGHAMRNGYIVVAPNWSRQGQREYEYTPREHHAVLSALRHAMRHASIDADRVFLAGHGEGATAAWDIALSHPDHWAGMISVNGEPSKTIQHYFPNARHVPLYFVMGELSGPTPPLIRMGPVLDDYMHVNNDATVVMYRGRGRESFYEEIPELFHWMGASMHSRAPIPQEFETRTMRRGDQYFWWLELGPLKPLVDLNPVLWDQEDRKRAGTVTGTIGGGNQIRLSGPADSFTVCLRPGMGVDMNQQIVIRYGSAPSYHEFDGDLQTILEDTRQRADRKRPFWMRISVP